MLPTRIDSLFLRLLLAQVLLVGCSLLVFGWLLIIERNQVVVPKYASVWAPRIVAAALSPAAAGADIVRQVDAPPFPSLPVMSLPAMGDFVRIVELEGVGIDDARMRLEQGRWMLWMQVHPVGAAPIWLSGPLPPELLPHWAPRMSIGVGLMALAIALLSRSIARGVTQPLAQLRRRMQDHARTGTRALGPVRPSFAPNSAPELIAIDTAYRSLAERLQRNERERELLLAGVSHDLRSPLSRIRLAAEMLPETEANAAGVASITRNVDHADRLTASFLEYVRSSTVELNQTVDLLAVTIAVVEGFGRPHRELNLRVPRPCTLFVAHEQLLERLIFNLVDNALKHGGLPVELELSEREGMVTLTVSDAGPGLPSVSTGPLTDAFARGDPSRGVPGFGLGLAIAEQILTRLQGTLSFERIGARHVARARIPVLRESAGA